MKIPKYIKQIEPYTHILIKYQFIKRVNDRLLLYENIKTGCKECFDIRELIKMKSSKIKKLTKYEWLETMYYKRSKNNGK
jgi:hypothetical protein